MVTLACSLEEFYVGSTKSFQYCIDEVQHDGLTVAKKQKSKTVQVDPGFSDKTVLTFRGMGNQAPKQNASNLVIKFTQSHNKHFRRSGDDLVLTWSITFEDVLNFKPVQVKTLDGRHLTACFDELISPQTVRVIEGEGMPRASPNQEKDETPVKLLPVSQMPKGDLYLRFDIHFPKSLSNASR